MSISSQKPSLKKKPIAGDPGRIEERYALAMQSINYAVYDADLEGGEVYFSQALRDMLGMKPDDPAYTTGNITEAIHPDDLPAYREAIVAHFRGDTPRFEVDFRYRAVDGNWRWCRQYGVAVRHPDGRAYRIVGAMSDVTETRQRDRELETAKAEAAAAYRQGTDPSVGPQTANEERYALAMESVNYGLYDWNLETGYVYYSPGLRILLGLTADVLSKPEDWTTRMHPSDRPLYQRRLIEHLKGDTPRFSCDVRYLTEDGTWRWARQHGIAFRGPDGRAKRLIGAAGDITEIKQREFELEAARSAAQRVLPVLRARRQRSRVALRARARIDQRRRRRLRHQSRHRHGVSRAGAGRSPEPAGIWTGERLRGRRPSGRPPASHPHDRRALQGRDPAARHRIPLSRARRNVALGAPARHRGARARRHRAPHGRRDRRHHRDAPARAPARRWRRRKPRPPTATSSRRARSCRPCSTT